jgi:hypothetical protein
VNQGVEFTDFGMEVAQQVTQINALNFKTLGLVKL